jgi:hypothetical protein
MLKLLNIVQLAQVVLYLTPKYIIIHANEFFSF